MGNSIEKTGKFYYGDQAPKVQVDESLLLDKAIRRRNEEAAAKEASELLIAARIAKQKEIDEKVERLEILPIGNKVILLPYPENPYRKIVTSSGILTDYNGEFLNPDSGEKDTLPTGVACAKVIEVGPDCLWTIPGDDVYYITGTSMKIPFYSQGYVTLSEIQLLCILNEGLKERFNKK